MKDSQSDWERIKKLKDENINLFDTPEVSENKLSDAVLRFGGRKVPKGKVRIK